jgi:hypothetical protein
METLHSLSKVTAGRDGHRLTPAVTVLMEHDDGHITQEQRPFGGFRRDQRAMVAWVMSLGVPLGVMDSPGLYWRSAYALLEQAGLLPGVVNAHHVQPGPGRKTERADAAWRAVLGRFGGGAAVSLHPRTCVNSGWSRATAANWPPSWRQNRTACTQCLMTPASCSGPGSPTALGFQRGA